MLRGHGSKDEQIVFQKKTRIKCMFTALQLVLAFTVSSSVVYVEKAINRKLPESAGSTEFLLTV